MLRRRLLLAAGGGAVCAALLLVGWPDPRRSLDLLMGRDVTPATESAFVILLCWLGAVIIALAAARGLIRRRWTSRPRPVWSLALLVIGIAVLGAGIAAHDGYRVCCATPTTAQEAERLVH